MAHDKKAGGGGPTNKECIPFLDTTPNQLFTDLISQQICRLISSLSGEDGSLILNLNTVDGLFFFP